MHENNPIIEILGATSLLAPHLLNRLTAMGRQGRCYSRSHPEDHRWPESFPWQALDAEKPGTWKASSGGVVISALPIWHTEKLLGHLSPCKQIIVFSSTSSITKTDSVDPKERTLSARLRQAEQHIKEFCEKNAIAWTILRPTLIYDPGKDGNVSAIARVIKKWKIVPVAAPALGLRQPVHADDLAAAAVAAINNNEAFNTDFNLTGGETLSYQVMIERIYQGMNRTPAILPLPPALLKFAMKCASLVFKTDYSPELFTRMNTDLTFDSSAAKEKLGYDPRPFQPQFSR